MEGLPLCILEAKIRPNFSDLFTFNLPHENMRLLIIGGGPAGYSAAFEAARLGVDVALVENTSLGGICLNHGCIPTKALRASADALVLAKRLKEFGVTGVVNPCIDIKAAQQRKEKIISILHTGLEKTAFNLGVRLIHGEASFLTPGSVLVKSDDENKELKADKILIATGSTDFIPSSWEFDTHCIKNSSQALDLDDIPANLLILGGGVVGCELACIFNAFGSDVTIVESQERLLPIPSIDLDVSALLAREMRKRKIKLFLNSTLDEISIQNEKVNASIKSLNKTSVEHKTIETDMLFTALGRAPNTGNLGLERIDIQTDSHGWIQVNQKLTTSVKNIYAAGDALGPSHSMLAHVAAMEGLVAVENLLGGEKVMDYGVVPCAIFTEPEIGCVGLSEQQARELYPNVISATTQMRELGKAQTMGELPGFFKLIVNGDNNRVLGAQITGAHASDILAEATLALAGAATIEDLFSTMHAHPTLAEGIWESAHRLKVNKNQGKR